MTETKISDSLKNYNFYHRAVKNLWLWALVVFSSRRWNLISGFLLEQIFCKVCGRKKKLVALVIKIFPGSSWLDAVDTKMGLDVLNHVWNLLLFFAPDFALRQLSRQAVQLWLILH